MSEDAYISLRSCHLNGDDDRRTWDFTQRGEDSAIPLHSGRSIPGHGPYWTGNFDEVQDFESDLQTRSGIGFLSDDDWKEAPIRSAHSKPAEVPDWMPWPPASPVSVRSSFTHRQSDGSLSPSAERGQTVFEDPEVGCAECHVGLSSPIPVGMKPANPYCMMWVP